MNPAALPYALLLLLLEFSSGGQLVLFVADLRGAVTRGFVKMGAGLISVGVLLTLWAAVSIAPAASVSGYVLSERFFGPTRVALAAFLLTACCYAALLFLGKRLAALTAGAVANLAAVAALVLIAALVERPTWSFAGTFASLLFGGLALGGVTLAMSLGHWYLVTPRLPEQPLNELTLALLAIVLVQSILLAINLAVPARGSAGLIALAPAQNPALWLRAGVGLALPFVLGFMAWQSSRSRGMMSATGLLYLATGAVLAGEALACSLLFSTAIPG